MNKIHKGGLLAVLALAALASATQAMAEPAGAPDSCSQRYHARLQDIREGELVAYREARTAIGTSDPALPGRLLFAAPRRPDLAESAREAADLGAVLVRRQGRVSFARDANTRWIGERIREDLTDYLRQGPSQYLCAGLPPYLATLRSYAAQGAPSPARIAEALVSQRATASQSLDAAFRAMRPAPLPRFAPADRPSAPAIEGLRLAMEMGLGEPAESGEPTRFAERRAASRISESQIDPDLPPLGKHQARALATEADLMRAITALTGTAARGRFMAEPGVSGGAGEADARPVLARLTRLRSHLSTPAGRIGDPIVRPAIEQALGDIELLDYLMAAANGPADPLTGAMYATMEAIETAHAQSCGCSD